MAPAASNVNLVYCVLLKDMVDFILNCTVM